MITPDLLRAWNPCAIGYRRFCQLFPNGADLTTAIEGLVRDGHSNWGLWLFRACQNRGLYQEIVALGYRNIGDENSGDENSGDGNTGDGNTGDGNIGDENSGDENSGDGNTGDGNIGDENSGDENSGDENSGDRNSGDGNTGNGNTGDRNSGYGNIGDENSGDWNSGHGNSGDENSGDGNSGYGNSGNWNSGNWNSGDGNTGHFNIDTPTTIRVFGRECSVEHWNNSFKPSCLYFSLTEWCDSDAMTAEEKAAHPLHRITGGFLRVFSYQEAFQRAWDKCDSAERMKVKELPNFDAEIFLRISGIDVRESS